MKLSNNKIYRNPLTLESEWEDYGIGDPFILRFNGVYYLYCSTKDGKVGVKSWQSNNLIDWNYIGLVTEEAVTETAYAPEVVYWNGYFYMYTSPGGNGHYVLKSTDPKGPFQVISKNLGMTIDGSVFIDDDGEWYFTYAGFNGIESRKMKSPIEFKKPIILDAFLGHWTEGSMMIKRQGKYYLTYTGNHVFSKGYRVNYAVSEDPTQGFYSPNNNPLIINTDSDYNGLGHSATVIGPNLDTYYIIYHNLEGRSIEGPPKRKLNIDRLVFNGDRMIVNGVSTREQEKPIEPIFSCENTLGSGWESVSLPNEEVEFLSQMSTEGCFISEFNFLVEKKGEIVLLFDYIDSKNYKCIEIYEISNLLVISTINQDKKNIVKECKILEKVDLTKHHSLRLERDKGISFIFIDGLFVEKFSEETTGGKIGYQVRVAECHNIGFTAFSNNAFGSSEFELKRSLPGEIEAFQYYSKDKEGKVDRLKKMNTVELENNRHGVSLKSGESLDYQVSIEENKKYGIDIVLRNKVKNSKISIAVNEGNSLERELSEKISDFQQFHCGILKINEKVQRLKLTMLDGELELSSIKVYEVKENFRYVENIFEEDTKKMGDWKLEEKGYSKVVEAKNTKLYFGEKQWKNYEIEAVFNLTEVSNQDLGGVMFRVMHESEHKDQVVCAYTGYYVGISITGISLFKINYASRLLVAVEKKIEARKHKLRIKVHENCFSVFLDGNQIPIIQYLDTDSFTTGKIGVEVKDSGLKFEKVSFNPILRKKE